MTTDIKTQIEAILGEGEEVRVLQLMQLFQAVEPESGARIPVWIPVTPDQRNLAEAWYDPTRKGWVLNVEFPKAAEHNVCDFDCDNCHNGGCGNPTCDRGGCLEDNATQIREDATWLDRLREGHAGLGCPICLTSICRFLWDD